MNTVKRLSHLLALVALLMPACAIPLAPAGELPAEVAVPATFATVNDQRLSSIRLDLAQMPPAAEDQFYSVWLVSDDGTWSSIGDTPVGGQVFEYVDPDGANLVGKYTGARISLADPANPAASFEGIVEGGIPPAILADVRLLVVSAPDVPNATPYDPGLKDQAQIAAEHAQLALQAIEANDLPGAQNHAEQIINVLLGAGDPGFGDHNGDGATQNPGDGFGVWPYAFRVTETADRIAGTSGLDSARQTAAANMAACARNISTQGPLAIEHAKAVLAAASAAEATAAAQSLDALLAALAYGTDANGDGLIAGTVGECGAQQIYELSHTLFDFVLTKSPTP
jgi:hypothetical protein